MNKAEARLKAKAIRAKCKVTTDMQNKFRKRLLPIIQSTRKPRAISGYEKMQSEFDVSFLIPDFLSFELKYLLPEIDEGSRILKFYDHENIEEYVTPDILLVPLLAFDKKGMRLGYGGGYYDTTLDVLHRKKDVLSIGVAYQEQLWDGALPREDHDHPLDFVVTPENVYNFV